MHAQAGIYCSNLTIERRKSQKVRNRALLETLEAINQHGQAYTLAELAELGLANPDHRRAELMLRIRDTEAEARRLGHAGMFYTVTAGLAFDSNGVGFTEFSMGGGYDITNWLSFGAGLRLVRSSAIDITSGFAEMTIRWP